MRATGQADVLEPLRGKDNKNMESEMMRVAHETAANLPGTVRRGASPLGRLLSCIRFDEVFVLQGTPLLGALYSIGGLTSEKAVALLVLLASSCCLVSHVFVLNDWSGASADLRDPNRAARAFVNRGIGRTEIYYLGMALLALSLLLLSPFGLLTLVIVLAIAGLSVLYSAPTIHVKGIPLLSSVLHLIGGMLHFLLGYSLFSAVDTRGLKIGCFFALIFAAGHLTHEARDRDGDMLNGNKTNAVTFGRECSFAAGLAFFTIATGLLVLLAVHRTVPHPLVLVGAFYPLQLYWSSQTLHAGLDFASIRRLQVRYRVLYAIIGVIMVVTVLLDRRN